MNTSTDRPDTALRAWLELGPDRGRPEGLERALAATRRVPQRPGWSFPERWLLVNRTLLAAAAAAVITVATVTFVLKPTPNIGPPASPTPAAQPTPEGLSTEGDGVVPAELMHTWVGAPHDFPGHTNVQALNFGFQFGQLIVSVNYLYGQDGPISHVAVVGPNTLELTAVANGCGVGVVGHYAWTLSPGGTLLHLAKVDDSCEARSAALAGDWHAANCKDTTDVCWGDMEAGTYPTLFYSPRNLPADDAGANYGAMTFTVPDGWAEGGDHTTDFRLLRSSDYAKESSGPVGQQTEIEGWIRPSMVQGAGCGAGSNGLPEGTPYELTTWLQKFRTGIVASQVHRITLDGHLGRWIDVHMSPDWTDTCGFTGPSVPLMTEAVGQSGPIGTDPWAVGVAGQQRTRLIFLDISGPDPQHTAMIVITARNQATFDSFIDDAMQVVSTFHFK